MPTNGRWDLIRRVKVNRFLINKFLQVLEGTICCQSTSSSFMCLVGLLQFSYCPDRLWGPPCFLFNGYRDSSPGLKRPVRQIYPKHSSRSEVTYEWSHAFTASACLQGTEKGKFIVIYPYPTAFPYGNGMVLHFYQQQESSMTKTVHKVINKRLKTYV